MTKHPVLDPEEIAALQAAFGEEDASRPMRLPPLIQPDPKDVQPFALGADAATDPGRFPAFVNLHDRLAEALRERWSELFGRECQITREGMHKRSYREVVEQATASLWVALEERGLGRFYARMDLVLALAAVDAMLGGPGELEGEPPAHLTPLELRLARHLAEDFAELVAEAWRPVQAMQLKVLRVDHDPQFLGVAAPEAICHAVVWSVARERAEPASVELGYPAEFVRGVLQALDAAQREEETRPQDPAWQAALLAALKQVPAELALEIGRTRISLGAFLHLRAGDELHLQAHVQDPALLRVRGTPFAKVKIREDDGRLRAEILARIGGGHG